LPTPPFWFAMQKILAMSARDRRSWEGKRTPRLRR
jgi:hypothetical protein